MNDYKRFVSYIYNYEMKIKKNNVGFARVETKNNQCKITVHIQAKSISNRSIKLYGFLRDEVDFVAIPLGEVLFKNGSGDGQLLTRMDRLGDSSIDFEKIGGLILYLSDNKYFGTEWDDKPLVFKEFRLLEDEDDEELPKEVSQEEGLLEKTIEAAEIRAEQAYAENDHRETEQSAAERQNRTAQKIRTEWQSIVQQQAVAKPPEATGQPLQTAAETKEETVEATGLRSFFEAYTLTDILERFSYAVTDNFMLHGFYRFGHLGVMKKNDKFVLGVPGIFCKREEMVANRSGFHNFYPKNGGNLHYGDFGYWYTSIEYLK